MATATSKQTEFPTPADRPDGYVLIFDGHCKFCRANIWWLAKIDQGKVAYISLHDPQVTERWPDLTYDQMMQQIYLVDHDGNKHGGAAALRFLSRKLVALWILAPLLHIPGSLPLWQFCYKSIARIRYRFGRVEDCDNGTCSIHFEK